MEKREGEEFKGVVSLREQVGYQQAIGAARPAVLLLHAIWQQLEAGCHASEQRLAACC